ncbi:MAG TPA: EAL domain-containing protein [Candidatus Elarobacter sp.]|jgi:diguanylate cyclase (GGDEF)-like protein/PAS domain S-box-containing protein|nr:EAL domain-containing protein [Candidatus Elarobacter sp.]
MIQVVSSFVALALATVAAIMAARWWTRGRTFMETARNIAADAVERRYNVLEAVRDGVYIVDDDLRVTHVNEEAERLLHRTADEMIGMELPDVVDPLASELVPDIRAARRSGIPIERVHAFPSLQTWVEVRILPAADETLISLLDVSAQTIAESQLHENAHSLQMVANNVDAILWTVGRDGRFTAVSGGALDELGFDSTGLVGQQCTALVAESVVRDVFTGRHVRVENAHGDHWLRHHVEPLADRNENIIGAVGVSIDITELKRTQRQLFDAAHRDRLTGLPNRFSLDQRVQEAVALAAREERRIALLFLDLDRFKAINDTLGHGAGDEVLREVSGRLQKCLRGGDFIARTGGDEFVVIMQSVADAKDIEQLAQRVIKAVSAPIQLPEREVYVGVSIGAAIYPDHGTDAGALTAHADAAMYRAKGGGGAAVAIYDQSIHAQDAERFALEADLRSALQRGELELEYQPLFDLDRRTIVGCEALVRWRHPERGTVAPSIFIPIAEESSVIVEIDRWVLRQACAAAATFRAHEPEFRMAVNLSARDLREPTLAATVAATLEEYAIPPAALILEVTETAALDDTALPALQRLRELGVQLAMDDFGIGYSSLAHLKRLPITMLKIDRTFVRDIAEDESDSAIVVSMIHIAKAFGLRVVAEGIETEEQAALVTGMGCDEGQGYRLGMPQRFDSLLTLIRTSRRPNLRLVEMSA